MHELEILRLRKQFKAQCPTWKGGLKEYDSTKALRYLVDRMTPEDDFGKRYYIRASFEFAKTNYVWYFDIELCENKDLWNNDRAYFYLGGKLEKLCTDSINNNLDLCKPEKMVEFIKTYINDRFSELEKKVKTIKMNCKLNKIETEDFVYSAHDLGYDLIPVENKVNCWHSPIINIDEKSNGFHIRTPFGLYRMKDLNEILKWMKWYKEMPGERV